MKRRLAIIFSLVMLICLAPRAALAAGDAYADTPLNNSSAAKIQNIQLAVDSIDGYQMEYGDTFSFNGVVGFRTRANGFRLAPNGRGVSVVGGGVAQAATTMYLALLQLDDIEFNSLRTYGAKFADDYVDSGYDAILTDDDANIDFSFTSYYPGTLAISMWVNEDSVSCSISLDGGGGSAVDMVGYASTPVYGTADKIANIDLAAGAVYGATLNRYDEFSFNGVVGPRTKQAGYKNAVNGRGALVVGGGVAQVASAIYMAVKDLDQVSIQEKHTYGSFTESYVTDPDDAVMVDYNAGSDFSFIYMGDSKLTIYTYISDGELICEVDEG